VRERKTWHELQFLGAQLTYVAVRSRTFDWFGRFASLRLLGDRQVMCPPQIRLRPTNLSLEEHLLRGIFALRCAIVSPAAPIAGNWRLMSEMMGDEASLFDNEKTAAIWAQVIKAAKRPERINGLPVELSHKHVAPVE
jgi:hypothetical protein